MLDGRPVITGNNLIKIYNGEYYEIDSDVNFLISRIVLDGEDLIIGNKHGIKVVRWNITSPVITCGVKKNSSDPGLVNIMVDVVAECNLTYLEEQHINK